MDLSLSRDIRVGGNRRLELRLDAFNAFNSVIYNNRQNQIQFNSPTDLTIRNSQFLANGQIDPARLTPRNAGFGAATGAQAMRRRSRSTRGSRSNAHVRGGTVPPLRVFGHSRGRLQGRRPLRQSALDCARLSCIAADLRRTRRTAAIFASRWR